MPKSQFIFFLFFAVLQLLLGIFANGIILVGNGIDLVKERKMAPLALLLSCLAVSRICLQLLFFFMNLFFLSLIQVSTSLESFVIVLFTNEVGLWLATWLGVFYCIKIATFHHPLFLWLKMRISRLLPWLVLGSLLCAAISSGTCSTESWMSFQKALQTFFSRNATSPIKETSALSSFFVFGCFAFPFLVFLVAALLLILSLGRHTWQLRSPTAGARFPSRSAHVRALLSVLSFLFLYFSHLVVALLLSSQVFPPGSLMFMLCLLISGAYPSGHSVILILGNSKLKQNAKRLLLPCDRFREPVTPTSTLVLRMAENFSVLVSSMGLGASCGPTPLRTPSHPGPRRARCHRREEKSDPVPRESVVTTHTGLRPSQVDLIVAFIAPFKDKVTSEFLGIRTSGIFERTRFSP
nr:taste receptor type 2 member 1 [Oryctolagus cuniculus]